MGRVIKFNGRNNGLTNDHDKNVVTMFATALKWELSTNYLLDDDMKMAEAYKIIDRKWEEFMGIEHPKSVAYFRKFIPADEA